MEYTARNLALIRRPVPALRTLLAVATGVLVFLMQIKIGTSFPHDLDASWQQVLSWGIAHHEQWGRDLVFTYGPLGFMGYDGKFDPATYWTTLSLQLALAAAAALLLIDNLRNLPAICGAVFALGSVILGWSWSTSSALIIIYPLAAMSLERVAHSTGTSKLHRYAIVAALGALAAALPLLKFSVFPLWLVWLPFGLFVLRRSDRRMLVLAFTLASTLAPIIIWLACGQQLANFGAWLKWSWQLAEYYPSAMQTEPKYPITDWVALGATVYWLLVLAVFAWRARRFPGTVAVYALFAATFVLSYKAGMTRAGDGGHVMFVISTCTLCAPLLAGIWYQAEGSNAPRTMLAMFIFAALSLPLMNISGAYPIYSLEQAYHGSYTYAYAKQQIQYFLHPRDQFQMRLKQWRQDRSQIALPLIKDTVGQDSVDILLNDQSVLLANNLNYRPRPAFQSYSAYSAKLAELNAAFFKSKRAPNWVMLNWRASGDDYPTSEDSRALLRVLQLYSPLLAEGDYLLFHRNAGPAPTRADTHPAVVLPLHPNAATTVPVPTSDAWFAKFNVKLSLYGKVAALLFREPQVTIEVGFSDGSSKRYTIARDIARSGFMLSPALDSNASYLMWLQGDRKRYVTSLRLVQQKALNHRAFKISGPIRLYPLIIPRNFPRTLALYHGLYPGFNQLPASVSEDMRIYTVDGKPVLFLAAPARISFDLPAGTYAVSARFGLVPNALTDATCIAAHADGIGLEVKTSNEKQSSLPTEYLNPFKGSDHRYAASYSRTITVGPGEKVLVFLTQGRPGSNGSCDWSWIRDLKFIPIPAPHR